MELGVGASERSERAWFVVLDGVDGCGKTTQALRLAQALEERRGTAPVHLREPGTTAAGEAIRALLLSRESRLVPAVEALLFTAARRQLLEERVAPSLAAGVDVVCERFHAATYAYQAAAGGLDPDDVLTLLQGWAGAPEPDLEIVLDVEVEAAFARRAGEGDRIEDRGLEFQRAVARGFRDYVERTPRARCVDASGDVDDVHRAVLAQLTTRMQEVSS